jgi:hypothetical protein
MAVNEVQDDTAQLAPAEEPIPESPTPSSPAKRGRWRSSLSQVHGFWAFLIILLSAVIAGFADPNYGWNGMSLRLLITFAAVFIVLNYGGAIVKRIFGSHRGHDIRPRMTARPIYLVIILVTILFGRGTDINPALVFGSVLALDYGLQTAGSLRSAIATMAGALWAAVLGLGAFVGYTFLVANPISSFIQWDQIDPTAAFQIHQLTQFGNVALGEFFSALCIAALSSLPISLLPFAFLEGSNLWRRSKLIWVVAYAMGAAVYSYVLVPLPASWDEISTTFSAWAGIYLAYAAFAIALWALFRFTRKSAPAA